MINLNKPGKALMRLFTCMVFLSLALPQVVVAQDVDSAKAIFKKRCKSCHRLTAGKKMGPSLLGVTNRRTDEWLDEFLAYPKKMIKKGDPTAVALKKKYKRLMPKVKEMQDPQNRKDMIGFLKQNDGKSVSVEPKEPAIAQNIEKADRHGESRKRRGYLWRREGRKRRGCLWRGESRKRRGCLWCGESRRC